MNILDFIQGFIIGSTLIVAIGPQNLFVINQGLKKKYVLLTVLFCSISDSLLIILGINLSNLVISLSPYLINVLKILGGIWLIVYGFNKIIKTDKNNITRNQKIENDFIKTLSVIFLITYANPHVYLDTVILIGSISVNFEQKLLFGTGAILASFVFFFTLGYLSTYISNYISSKKTLYRIDLLVATLMILYGNYFIFF